MPYKRAAPTAGPHSQLVDVDGSLTTTMRIFALLLACCLCALLVEPLEARSPRRIDQIVGDGLSDGRQTLPDGRQTLSDVRQRLLDGAAAQAVDGRAENDVFTRLQLANQVNKLRSPHDPPGPAQASPLVATPLTSRKLS